MTTSIEILNSWKNIPFNSAENLAKVRDIHSPYNLKVCNEAHGISISKPKRDIHEIIQKCEFGMIAEINVREYKNGEYFTDADIPFYDLKDPSGNLFEIKRWKQEDIEFNKHKYLTKDLWNKSDYLVIYTYDDTNTWLHEVVEVDQATRAKQPNSELPPYRVARAKEGSSFTIYDPVLQQLLREPRRIIFDVNGKDVERSIKWFDKNKRQSRSGYLKGGWYVWDWQLK